ncbi:hypothetical protein CEXT_237851 [Caerostris extrusa]|uniref:Uncharacterized protein n=1 Tax=Caerostris extrusa TaxID=172846 RepID=A0AAV4XEC4_CAEEX|nr:hypothetical protein CEXT_237851 [Caerostris extrusa]
MTLLQWELTVSHENESSRSEKLFLSLLLEYPSGRLDSRRVRFHLTIGYTRDPRLSIAVSVILLINDMASEQAKSTAVLLSSREGSHRGALCHFQARRKSAGHLEQCLIAEQAACFCCKMPAVILGRMSFRPPKHLS